MISTDPTKTPGVNSGAHCTCILTKTTKILYYFCIKTMFGLSLPLVVCSRAHVLLCFFCVCLRIVMMSYHNVFKFWVPCCNINVHYDFRIKKSSIHLYFQLFVGRLIYLCPTLLTMRVTWRVSYKTQKLLDLHGRLGSPRGFGGVRVPYLFIFFFCIVFFFVCLRPVSCIPNAVSFAGISILDCPFGLSSAQQSVLQI
jgi:hypothetical protein